MNPSVAYLVVKTEKPKKAAMVVPEVVYRNIPQYALSAEKKLKFPSNPDRADPFIAAPATVR